MSICKNYLISILLIANSLSAQHLNKFNNKYQSGDIIIKQQINYKESGGSGTNVLWDFSEYESVNENYKIDFFYTQNDDSTLISSIEHNTTYRYDQKSDTLFLNGFYNRTTTINYKFPEAILKFPFYYGDSLKNSFEGTGLYCQKVKLKAKGTNSIYCDAIGNIIMPNKDTVKNVIRIHRVKDYLKTDIDSVNIKLDIFQWYITGIRHPVFETVKSITQKGDSVLEKFSTAFYMSSINQKTIKDYIESSILYEKENILLSCNLYPNPVSDNLYIRYELSIDAKVTFILCNINGVIYKIVPEKIVYSGIQTEEINMSNLHIGNYVLYVKVQDKIYRMTIIKS